MSINPQQFKDWVVVPALTGIGLCSDSAVNLLMLTASTESQMGTYLKQLGTTTIGGYGIYQIEKTTHDNVWGRFIVASPNLRTNIRISCGYENKPILTRLINDLTYATIIARLVYNAYSEPLPKPDDIVGLATYWKKYYNSVNGAGTVEEAVDNYKKYGLII